MKYYFKNIFKNILKNKASYFGAISVIALGILIYIAMMDVLYNLKYKVTQYYNDYHFAQAFATVSQMPIDKLDKLKEIEGIDDVFGRLSVDARLLIEGQNNIVTLHLLAYDDDDNLNQFKLTPAPSAMGENMIFLGTKMKNVYDFKEGDTLTLIIGSEEKHLTLAGTLQAPEYIYSVPPSGVQMPDNEIYDIACIRKDTLENLLGKQNMVNELGFTLKNGYDFDDVKYELEEKLTPYGVQLVTNRKDQLSNSMIREEFNQLSAMAFMLPFIFLVVAMFMLYIILKKMIASDRSLIGTLKAFGFTDHEILGVYLWQSFFIGIVGSIIGQLLSTSLGKYMFNMYRTMYNLPYNHYDTHSSNFIVGLFIAISTSLLATYLGVREVLRIHPAEAMRTAAPSSGKNFILPQFLNRFLNARQKMGLRHIFRNKFRSFVIALAITFPFAFVSVINTVGSICESVFLDQFTKVQTYDLKISLDDYVPYEKALAAGNQIEGAYNIDAAASYTPLFTFKNRSEYASLTALTADSPVWHIMDYEGNFFKPPKNGIIMNQSLAKKLGVKAGDIIEITSSYFSPAPVKMTVTQIVGESLGGGCYIDIQALSHYFNIEPMANTILLNCAPSQLENIKSTLSSTYHVTSVTDATRTLKNYRQMMQSMMSMINVFSYFSIIAGIILIYNISNISLRERQNEFGTLSILGTKYEEIREIITFEQGINFLLGILLGLPGSVLFKQIVATAILSDNYTLDLKITFGDYLYAFIICLLIMLISLHIILKNIKKMDLTSVLKERE